MMRAVDGGQGRDGPRQPGSLEETAGRQGDQGSGRGRPPSLAGSRPVLISKSSTHAARMHVFRGLQRVGNHIRTLASTREELPGAGEPLGSSSCLRFLPAASARRGGIRSPPRWSAGWLLFLAFPHVPFPPSPFPLPGLSEPRPTSPSCPQHTTNICTVSALLSHSAWRSALGDASNKPWH